VCAAYCVSIQRSRRALSQDTSFIHGPGPVPDVLDVVAVAPLLSPCRGPPNASPAAMHRMTRRAVESLSTCSGRPPAYRTRARRVPLRLVPTRTRAAPILRTSGPKAVRQLARPTTTPSSLR
jgi:hypothetical protein